MFSGNNNKHLEHLRSVFDRLQPADLKLKEQSVIFEM